MHKPFILYGWHLSYFTGKVRCYLAYKRIEFVDQAVDMYTLLSRIKRKTGVVVMPVLRTPQGVWLQDSSVIIDQLEARFGQFPVVPTTPVQRFTAYLLEAWGDEFWIPIAMHTRWSYPENYALFEREAGAHLLPNFPAFLQRKAVAYVANSLRNKLHVVGVRPEQFELMNAWSLRMLDLLDAHFAQHPFLLGGHPTLADFGLVGSMYGHLGRDPWPAREWVAPRKHLRAWIDRMADPTSFSDAPLLADDAIASTLVPVLQTILDEFVPMLEGINTQVRALLHNYPVGKPLPRGLGDVEFPMGAGHFRRAALPYTLWMAQRVLDCHRGLPQSDRQQVAAWLRQMGGERLLQLDIPRLRQAGLRVVADPV